MDRLRGTDLSLFISESIAVGLCEQICPFSFSVTFHLSSVSSFTREVAPTWRALRRNRANLPERFFPLSSLAFSEITTRYNKQLMESTQFRADNFSTDTSSKVLQAASAVKLRKPVKAEDVHE